MNKSQVSEGPGEFLCLMGLFSILKTGTGDIFPEGCGDVCIGPLDHRFREQHRAVADKSGTVLVSFAQLHCPERESQ